MSITTLDNFSHISGKVWLDQGDGLFDPLEDVPLSNLLVELYDSVSNQLIQTTNTHTSGHFIFIRIPKGEYYIRYYKPPILIHTLFILKGTGTSQILSTDSTYGQSDCFILDTEPILFRDAPLIKRSTSIKGIVFEDANWNGLADAGEARLSHLPIKVIQGSHTSTIYTNSQGIYTYTLIDSSPVMLTFPSRRGFTFACDSQFPTRTDRQLTFTTIPSDPHTYTPTVLSCNCAYLPNRLSLSGHLLLEESSTLSPLSDITIKAFNMHDQLMGATRTTQEGLFKFDNLSQGTYSLHFSLPQGYFLVSSSLPMFIDTQHALLKINLGISSLDSLSLIVHTK